MTLIRRDFLTLAAGAVLAGGVAPTLAARAWADETYAIGDMVLGAAEAPVTIIEYASMTCPHCADFHNNTFPDLKAAYIDTGKVRLIYREFPLDPLALRAAMLARCAGPKLFFAFIEVLFQKQSAWARADDPIAALAKLGRIGGIGRQRFDMCMSDQELATSILKTRLDGSQELEVDSTPTFIINGKRHRTSMDFEQFQRILEPILGGD